MSGTHQQHRPGGPIHVMDVGGSHVTAAVVTGPGATIAPDAGPASGVATVTGGVPGAGFERADVAGIGADVRWAVRASRTRPLDAGAPRDALLEVLVDAAREVAAEGAPAWTIAMPGPFDPVRGVGDFRGMGKFEALTGVDLRAALADRLGVPPTAVGFCNDAVAYGIGEWAAGAGERAARMVCLTLGTGVGSAFLDHGVHVDHGDLVPARGEAHTIRLDGRPLEETVSTAALRDAYARATGAAGATGSAGATDATGATQHGGGADAPSVREIADRARQGDIVAARVISTTMTALGRALGPWVRRFGASRTVIGGAMAGSWDLLEEPLATALADAGAVTELRQAQLGSDAPLIGAACCAPSAEVGRRVVPPRRIAAPRATPAPCPAPTP
ncbi:ROK family protein [Curtobacterium sp. MCBD17_013]|uniref:ROK family protein n=1 Tax=Curtobacterium sp. MCBD17_013 TaxID=2175668 RepID=UPI0011B3E416|nr:ROK family protein [Curtobacterium sp. MCBD17_013]